MPSSRKKSTPRSRPANRGGYVVTVIHSGPLQKGGGLGGVFKGWIRRAIPIIKAKAIPLAKSVGRDLAVHTLDSVYNVGRDILVNKKDPLDAVYNQGKNEISYIKNKITRPFQTEKKTPVNGYKAVVKRAIKRHAQSKSLSVARNAKRKRANKKFRFSKINEGGFKKITL